MAKDAFLGSDMIGNPRCILNDKDYQKLYENKLINSGYLGEIYYVNTDNISALESATADCDNLMFHGKAAGKTLAFLTALGLADGENFPTEEIHREDVLGGYLYIDVVKDKDSDFLKFPWSSNGYRTYEGKAKAKPKKEEVEELESLVGR